MPELQTEEWKEIWKDEYLAWICGFANAQGGTLYIGKNDEGKIVGVKNSRKLLEDLPNKIRDALGIIVPIRLLEDSGKEYLKISVQSYPIAISYKGTYYYRSGSTNQRLVGLELESFLLHKQGATWDNLPLPSFTLLTVGISPRIGLQQDLWESIPPSLLIPILPMFIIWQVSLKAGDVASKKYAMPAKRIMSLYPNMILPAILL